MDPSLGPWVSRFSFEKGITQGPENKKKGLSITGCYFELNMLVCSLAEGLQAYKSKEASEMNRTARILSLSILIALTAPLGLLHGCGDKTTSAPNGSTIEISPEGKTWDTSQMIGCNASSYNFELFTITVRDSFGNPMDNVTIYIDLDLASSTASPNNQVMYLADADIAQKIPVVVPYETKTGDFGTKNVQVFVDIGGNGCEYNGQLKVYSATAFESVEIEVNFVEPT
jgi:hypothetical protein